MQVNGYNSIYSESSCRHGYMRYLALDDPIGKSLSTYGEWAEGEISLILKMIRQGDTVLDVGAYIGTHTIPISKAVGLKGCVFALEPQKEIFKILQWNIDENCKDIHIEAINVCAGENNGEQVFPDLDYSSHNNFGMTKSIGIGEIADRSYKVQQLSLDSIAMQSCDFIKLDAEGSELAILRGASRILEKFRPIIYAECNSIEGGEALIKLLKSYGYSAYYHKFMAYNLSNFAQKNSNIFGQAHESSLVFVSADRLYRIQSCHDLLPLQTYGGLRRHFLDTLRFGESRLESLDREKIEFIKQHLILLELERNQEETCSPEVALGVPVIVIIPIHNAAEAVQSLFSCLHHNIAQPIPGLAFIIADDRSTDPKIETLCTEHSFAVRPDVIIVRSKVNLGFVKNINTSFALACSLSDQADFLILNSDTTVPKQLVPLLQRVAYSKANIASVTPLTNNGTIASLFNWPEGVKDVPSPFTTQFLADVANSLNFQTLDAEIPTGVGFCMYIRREAFHEVGYLSESYGKGYGEECDWCQVAVSLGYKNILTSQVFVEHLGGQSFGNEEKRDSIERNSQVLNLRHPDYNSSVVKHMEHNPNKFKRLMIILEAVRRLPNYQGTHLFTLHTDLDQVQCGGTEFHVRDLRQKLVQQGYATLVMAPLGSSLFMMRYQFASLKYNETIHEKTLASLIAIIEPWIDHLHMHHALNWPRQIIETLADSSIERKSLSIHDLWFICPSINLLTTDQKNEKKFCGVEQNQQKCGDCYKKSWMQENLTIASHRRFSLALFKKFGRILLPSENVAIYLKRAFGAEWTKLAEKVKVLHHDLSYIVGDTLGTCSPPGKLEQYNFNGVAPIKLVKPRVYFVGAIGTHKGARILLEALASLVESGFEAHIVGRIDQSDHPALARVKLSPYEGIRQLADRLNEGGGADFICIPSICPETFCYTFFESLLLQDFAIPVVGPYGYPAQIVNQYEIGTVMKDSSVDSLVDAIMRANDDRPRYLLNLEGYRAKLKSAIADESYLNEYLFATNTQSFRKTADHTPTISPLSLTLLSDVESLGLQKARLEREFRLFQQDHFKMVEQKANIVCCLDLIKAENVLLMRNQQDLLFERNRLSMKFIRRLLTYIDRIPALRLSLLGALRAVHGIDSFFRTRTGRAHF